MRLIDVTQPVNLNNNNNNKQTYTHPVTVSCLSVSVCVSYQPRNRNEGQQHKFLRLLGPYLSSPIRVSFPFNIPVSFGSAFVPLSQVGTILLITCFKITKESA